MFALSGIAGETSEAAEDEAGKRAVPGSSAIGGRGLGIVERLSLRWGVFTGQDGAETTVWAALPLSEARPGLVIASSRDA